ncbi:SGNH hydrolase-type esterase domain containing protein [Rhypophila sp. PSN 637]
MKYKLFVPAVAWVTAALFSGAAAKPLLGLDELSPARAQTTPKPVPSCSFPSLENNDGLCTCCLLTAPTATATPAEQKTFSWAVIRDSWSSGVAYSYSTSWSPWTDWEYCYRSNEAYGAMMYYNGSSWIDGNQIFGFVACGGTKMDDIRRQLGESFNRFWGVKPQLVLGTFGGNDGFFGDIARACIYKPDPDGPWGSDHDNDPNGTGWCKKYFKQAREFIDRPDGLEAKFRDIIHTVYRFSQKDSVLSTRLDLYVSSYVKFFNAETDACDDWTFARWFSTGSPKLVKPLRREMNDLVGKFNDVQEKVINWYRPPSDVPQSARTFTLHYVPISDIFEGHRFCEPNQSFDDRWYSADVWLWNLSWKNGNLDHRRQETDTEQDEDASMNLKYWDNGDLPGHDSPIEVDSQSGFGWTARPFHPKPRGNRAMMDAYIAAFRRDNVPGVRH